MEPAMDWVSPMLWAVKANYSPELTLQPGELPQLRVGPARIHIALVDKQPVAQREASGGRQFHGSPGERRGRKEAPLPHEPGRGVPGIVRVVEKGKADRFALHDPDARAPGRAAPVHCRRAVIACAVTQQTALR